MCIVNVSTFHFWSPLSLQNKKIKKGKKNRNGWGSHYFLPLSRNCGSMVNWWCVCQEAYICELIVIFCLYTDHLEIFRTLLTSGAIYRSPQLMILTRQNFSYLSLITAIILCKPQIHLMKNTQLLFLAKQINQCFVEHV